LNKVFNLKISKIGSFIKTIFALLRIRNALISFLGVYVGAILFISPIPVHNVILAGLSAALILGGGNTLNDYFDVDTDKTNKPWRPIPSGKISMSDAFMLAIVFFMIGIGIANRINKSCMVLAILNTILLIVYAKYSKRLLLLSNVTISYLVASVFIYGAFSTINNEQLASGNLLLISILVCCSFLMTFSREIIKDIEDIEGDTKIYAKSLPIVIGVKKSNLVAVTIGISAVLLSVVPIFYHTPMFNTLFYAVFIFLADLLFIVSFTMHPALAQRSMIAGMTLSLLAFLTGGLIAI